MIASGQSPWHTRAELESLHDQLVHAQSGLPVELQSSSQNLTFRATTSSFTTFVMFHAHWHQILCDLYRIMIPGKRESVSPEAFAATPLAYVSHCQQQCLQSAQDGLDFFVRVCDLPERKQISDSFFGVIAFQYAQVLTAGISLASSPPAPALCLQLQKVCELIEQSEGSNIIMRNCVRAPSSKICSFADTWINRRELTLSESSPG